MSGFMETGRGRCNPKQKNENKRIVVEPRGSGEENLRIIPPDFSRALRADHTLFPGSLTRKLYRKKILEIVKMVDIVPSRVMRGSERGRNGEDGMGDVAGND
jgi:hypothetical protein